MIRRALHPLISLRTLFAPACLFHGLLVVELLHNSVCVVILLVDIACLVSAIHGGALQAAIVLVLLHAATNILLGTWTFDHEACLVRLSAWVAILHGTSLIGLR